MTEVQLLPCPFCGGPAILCKPFAGQPYVACEDNFCSGPKATEAEAIAAWNRRADPPMTPHDRANFEASMQARAMFKKIAEGQG